WPTVVNPSGRNPRTTMVCSLPHETPLGDPYSITSRTRPPSPFHDRGGDAQGHAPEGRDDAGVLARTPGHHDLDPVRAVDHRHHLVGVGDVRRPGRIREPPLEVLAPDAPRHPCMLVQEQL